MSRLLRAEIEEKTGEAVSPATGPDFDSNAITPGTEFMWKCALFVRERLLPSRLKTPPASGGWGGMFQTLIFSDSSVAGEGEHKIVQYIRSLPAEPADAER